MNLRAAIPARILADYTADCLRRAALVTGRCDFAANVCEHRQKDFEVADQIKQGVIRFLLAGQIDPHPLPEAVNQGGAGCKSLCHHKAQDEPDILLVQPQELSEDGLDVEAIAIGSCLTRIFVRPLQSERLCPRRIKDALRLTGSRTGGGFGLFSAFQIGAT